jgi:hypothetical protein
VRKISPTPGFDAGTVQPIASRYTDYANRPNIPKNKFEKLLHLVGFVIRIYHDARSAERHIQNKHIFHVMLFFPLNAKVKEVFGFTKLRHPADTRQSRGQV